MQQDSVIALPHPWSTLSDPFTEVLRRGAQQLLAQAVEAEVATLLAQYADRRDSQGRKAVVRNGYLPEREVQTGIGSVPVKVPRCETAAGVGCSSTRRFCHRICGARKASRRCFPGSISKG